MKPLNISVSQVGGRALRHLYIALGLLLLAAAALISGSGVYSPTTAQDAPFILE